MQKQEANRSNQTVKALLLVVIGLLVVNMFGGWTAVRAWLETERYIRAVEYGHAVMTATPESWFAAGTAVPAAGNLVIEEQPAVIVATGAPPVYEQPSVPVAEPAEAPAPTAVPTHPPLPGSMQEAYEQGYWAMPITPEQFEQCKANPAVNPACQFYVKE